MANLDGPFGMRPIRHAGGGCIRNNEYTIAGGYATSLFVGDPVQLTGTGRNIELAPVASTRPVGVFAGCEYVNNLGEPKWSRFWPASTAVAAGTTPKALVYDDPSLEFVIQTVSGTPFAQAMVGQLTPWTAGVGNVASGLSGAEANVATLAAAGQPLRILRFYEEAENEIGEHARIVVGWAVHALRGVAAGVGGV